MTSQMPFSPAAAPHSAGRLLRVVYLLQLAAVLTMAVGMTLVWWQDTGTLTALDLLERSTRELQERSGRVIGQPLLVLWLLVPVIIVAASRSVAGLLVTPVSLWWLALATWLLALLAVSHFLIAFGGELPAEAPLLPGTIQPGYWLTALAVIALGVLLVGEVVFRPRRVDRFMTPPPKVSLVEPEPVEEESRYINCPYCGALNVHDASVCLQCQNVLVNLD
ncbi:MAG: hypothetical protein GXY36_03200 [Chloroflexi bacterium]|jgi:hypothetical protein|nr:hypothetical protein [Chloroflexota bacterium]